jgi:peptidoglycan/xylan/chitin deacetylase (PgdA/CDA1 family)
VYWSGGGRLFELLARPTGAIVLMYHSVAAGDLAAFVDPPNRIEPDLFERQMAFLATYRRVVPLSQVVAEIEAGGSPSAGTVCITFDDGYLDNLTTAAPILEKYRLPATLFLATGYVERGEAQWSDELHRLMQRRTSDKLHIMEEGGHDLDLATEGDFALARKMLHRHLLESDYSRRTTLLRDVERQLAPQGTAPRLTMTWDDARLLRRKYSFMDFGGHTRDHIDLSMCRGSLARAEVSGCADDLRRELDVEPRHFSFPYGRWCAETREMVSSSGWRSAVGDGDNKRLGPASDRFCIPRVNSPRTMTELRFKTSAAYPDVFPNPRLE